MAEAFPSKVERIEAYMKALQAELECMTEARDHLAQTAS